MQGGDSQRLHAAQQLVELLQGSVAATEARAQEAEAQVRAQHSLSTLC